MAKVHDTWYKKLFTNPRIVEDLLVAFVKEEFIQGIDFSSIKKLNASFVSEKFRNRESDVIYELKSNGRSAYFYLLIEFQSTVDRFMALRMASYVFQFHQEIQETTKSDRLIPVFPVLLYNGKERWNAPETFRELLAKSDIPTKFLPQFRYYPIAINRIPKRNLVKIRNAAAAVFYVENSTPEQILSNHDELIGILKHVFRSEGVQIVNSIVQWICRTRNVRRKSIKNYSDLMEVKDMWEEAVRRHEEKILERGIEKGIERGVEKNEMDVITRLVDLGMDDTFISKATGMTLTKVRLITKKMRKK